MKISSHNYLAEHAAGTDAHMADALVKGCKAVLHERDGFRGGLGDLGAAIGQTNISIPGLLTVGALRKHSAVLRTQGSVEIVLHDDEGRDIELMPVSET